MKDEQNEFYSNRSRQNLAEYQSTAANSLKQLSPARGYNLIVEKQAHPTVRPSLNCPAFQAGPDSHTRKDEKCILDEQETIF